jgi:hypothetical protein
MARNDTRSFIHPLADHARQRAVATSWPALASATVASALVAAIVVSALVLAEVVFSNPAAQLARESPASPEVASRHARVN